MFNYRTYCATSPQSGCEVACEHDVIMCGMVATFSLNKGAPMSLIGCCAAVLCLATSVRMSSLLLVGVWAGLPMQCHKTFTLNGGCCARMLGGEVLCEVRPWGGLFLGNMPSVQILRRALNQLSSRMWPLNQFWNGLDLAGSCRGS